MVILRHSLRIDNYWGTHLSDVMFRNVLNIFETNMLHLYQMSQDGYNQRSKHAELRASTSRYLIVHLNDDENSIPIAFCHYRFDIDHSSSVVYWYVR
jgi:hypothetical protein